MNVMPTKSQPKQGCGAYLQAYRLQALCGTISPKTTINPVVMNMPRTPAVASANSVAMAALTSVLPSSSVQSSKFPVFRSGWIFAADRPFTFIRRPLDDNSQIFRREGHEAQVQAREEPTQRYQHGGDDVLPDLHGCGVGGVQVDCCACARVRCAPRRRGSPSQLA